MSRPALLDGSVNRIYARALASNLCFSTQPGESDIFLPTCGVLGHLRGLGDLDGADLFSWRGVADEAGRAGERPASAMLKGVRLIGDERPGR
jgi:hypothetical protein